MTTSAPQYGLWVDRGGTFTDCVLEDRAAGTLSVCKLLSTDDAPLVALRSLLGLAVDEPLPPCEVRLGTTLATNALLERKGAPTALVLTEGFGDLPMVGDQARPDLFALDIRRPPPIASAVMEVASRGIIDDDTNCRVAVAGSLIEPFRRLRVSGIESVAIALLHGNRFPHLEEAIAAEAIRAGFEHVVCSHEVSAEDGLVGRSETTAADAYLSPVVARYVARLAASLAPGSRLRVMQSNGGHSEAAFLRGKDAVLSGPAGGVVACAHIADRAALGPVIGFDMGGTSTDVSRYAGHFERSYETRVAGVRIRAPILAVHTVAAGGGSICRYAHGRFTVGPDSAGAFPGPLAYGSPEASELTLTDVNLALGRLVAHRFPIRLRPERVATALDAIADRLPAAAPAGSVHDRRALVAQGFLDVAVESMAAAIREVSVARGHDVRDHVLVVFGGAAGQVACALARRLGIATVVAHPLAGVMSAFGMGVAPTTWHGEAALDSAPLDAELGARVEALVAPLSRRAHADLAAQGVAEPATRVLLDLRYEGTETSLPIEATERSPAKLTCSSLVSVFESAHRVAYGYCRPGHHIEAVTVRFEAWGGGYRGGSRIAPVDLAPPPSKGRLWLDGAWAEVPLVLREALSPDSGPLPGPVIVLDATGTFVVEPGFETSVDAEGLLFLRARPSLSPSVAEAAWAGAGDADPIRLEVMANQFMSIAEQMGTVLRRTAISTNIRERLDFSCAVFDGEGGLVANAPHIPVHLGAMGESVRAVLAAHPHLRPGDVFATNDPAAGGSHLPDVTVVTPVHDPQGRVAFVVASRGHHADVGGITPGSMPPFSSSLEEEGVVIRPERVVREGRFDRAHVRALFTTGRYPARRPDDNVADLEAQIASGRTGVRLLEELAQAVGFDVVRAYMEHVQGVAEKRVREALAALPNGKHAFEDALDDGTRVCVALEVDGDRMRIDFAGTGPEVDGNLNAPRAVTLSAVLYVLRCLVDAPIPLNAGCARPVEVHIPAGSVLAPSPGRAVAGGNVETSQRVVDVLLGALGVTAASQGTMNNVTFGDSQTAYYETIGGGAGAGNGFEGASGVHVHMTNSRITDPEVLELRYPVRVWRFGLRRGSGGAGRWRGGDGLVRELELLRPMTVSIVSERRTRSPFGLAGGSDGARGRNLLDGVAVAGKAQLEVAAGQRLRIETPGGGGFGGPEHAGPETESP